jgi:hypothetical protein
MFFKDFIHTNAMKSLSAILNDECACIVHPLARDCNYLLFSSNVLGGILKQVRQNLAKLDLIKGQVIMKAAIKSENNTFMQMSIEVYFLGKK